MCSGPHPNGSYSCHDATRLQATRLSGKHDFACTDTEVLVLAFLLVGFGDNSLDPTTWANAVRAAAGNFERGQRWMVPEVLRSTARGSLRAEFERFLGAEIVAERMKAVLSAVNNFDGAGRSAAPLTFGVIRTYLRDIRRPASDKGAAWLGVSPAGVDAQHGETLRRIYVMPIVAQLLVDKFSQLQRTYAASHEEALDDNMAATGSLKTPGSALKVRRARGERGVVFRRASARSRCARHDVAFYACACRGRLASHARMHKLRAPTAHDARALARARRASPRGTPIWPSLAS